MVSRKPLPQSYSSNFSSADTGNATTADTTSGSPPDVPDILRPGRRPSPNPPATPAVPSIRYSGGFEEEEESVWRRQPPAQTLSAETASSSSQQPQYRAPPVPSGAPPGIPKIQTNVGAAPLSAETNPFKRKMQNQPATPLVEAPDTSIHTAATAASGPAGPAGPAASAVAPTEAFDQLSINEPSRNPWQPAIDRSRQSSPARPPRPVDLSDATTGAAATQNVWSSASQSNGPSRKATPGPIDAPKSSSDLINLGSGDDAAWDEIASPTTAKATAAKAARVGGDDNEEVYEDRHAWDDLGGSVRGNKSTAPGAPSKAVPISIPTEAPGEGWNMVDDQFVPGQLSRQSTWENFTDDDDDENDAENKSKDKPMPEDDNEETPKKDSKGKGKGNAAEEENDTSGPSGPALLLSTAAGVKAPGETAPTATDGQKGGVTAAATATGTKTTALPALPAEQANPQTQQPPRSLLDIGDTSAEAPPTHPPRPANSDKTETYQIKNINWYDVSAPTNPRVSPILLQNANGPCPLVALVNALTLTTPADMTTALVETLRSREQVSLSLLLDAVFDELMSSRRSDGEQDLPDVDELYRFLKGLHTGMNVNPRFVPTPDIVTAFKRTSLTHLHPTERSAAHIPGTFENTREMQLYATFNIPLIHGWLPSQDDAVCGALSRQAASYEDVQNLLFREEELEQKLSSPSGAGLTEDEQTLFQDIMEIKGFLETSATQLTAFGLDVLVKAMKPGTVAILFRNDHFSTLYRHPQTMQLMSLVTDAGYASHDEIVWETLVDVNGEHAEFYSGDFRLVGGASHQQGTSGTSGSGAAAATGDERGQSSGAATGSGGGRTSGWTTVHGKKGGKNQQQQPDDQDLSEAVARYEQEDRDLALALQLQEEEEERHRAEEERRVRESRLSEQFIEQQARQSTSTAAGGRASSGAGRGTSTGSTAGGGRYSSAPAISQRRSSAAAASSSAGRGGRPSNSSSTSVSASSSQNPPLPQRPAGQTVRPLIPPTTAATTRIYNPRPAVHRETDGNDEAPPSYEQAAKQAPYHPPPGTPQSEDSGPSTSTPSLPASSRPYRQGVPGTYAPLMTPQQQMQQQQQQAMYAQRDRECVIM